MIRVLGSGSSGNAVLVGDHSPVLLDAGLPLKRLRAALRGYGVTTLTKLAFVAVTHEHQDHAQAVEGLLKASVDVLASAGTLGALGVSDHYRSIALTPNVVTQVNGWGIIGIPVKHDAAEPMAFYVGRGSLRVLYVTDTESFAPPVGLVSKPTHVLIEANHRRSEMERRAEFDDHAMRVSSSHLSVEGAMETLARLDLSCCESIHLLHVSDRHGDEAGFVAEVSAEFGVPVHAAQAA
jgi:phosphoribosyl 1,2-cyclic phosphodiesterase